MLLRKKCTKGFTLIELIIVIAIIGILSSIAVPAYGGYEKKAKEQVCKSNCLRVERAYGVYLELEGIEHSGVVFEEYLLEYGKDICTGHGEINYVDGKVECSVHTIVEDDVPFL